MPARRKPDGLFKKVLRLLTAAACLFTVLGYGLSLSLWRPAWPADFWLLALPVAMATLVGLVGLWFVLDVRRAWLPLVVVVLGWPLWRRLVAFHQPLAENARGLRVLNYNIMSLDTQAIEQGGSPTNARRMLRYIADTPADIKCFQEFFNGIPNTPFEEFNTTEQLRLRGFRYFRHFPGHLPGNKNAGWLGLAVFSKYPIIKADYQDFNIQTNGYLWADIRLPGGDTIRVINIQLQSMGIRVRKVSRRLKQRDYEQARRETRGIVGKLKAGFDQRQQQLALIERLLSQSPHPVVLCGDLNEVPTGYVYGRLRKRLHNAFEEAGQGVGFTYNRSPSFIRIDNIFYDPAHFRVRAFNTDGVTYSDHNPVRAVLEWK